MSAKRNFAASSRKLNLRPATRAIRVALVASAAALALGASGGALAQSCVQTATNVVTCTGVFTDNVTTSIPVINLVPDLTVIIGDTPTSVTPAPGVEGIVAAWGGTVTVLSYADIVTSGADAILQYGAVAAALAVYGDITTEVLAPGDNAIDISALGTVDVSIGGDVLAYSDAALDVVSVVASSIDADVNLLVDAAGSVTAQAYDGDAIALLVDAYTTVDATIDGVVLASATADALAGVANAIGLEAVGSDIDLYNTGVITGFADAYLGSATGVVLEAADAIYVYNSGEIIGEGVGGVAATGLSAIVTTAGDVEILNTGLIQATAEAATATALIAETPLGDVLVTNLGDIYAYAYAGFDSIAVRLCVNDTGNAVVENLGTITANVAISSCASAATEIINIGDIIGDIDLGDGDDIIDNPGDIDGDIDTGAGDDCIYNEGNISGDIYTGPGDDCLFNGGTITGDIGMGDGDDYLYNEVSGVWNVGDNSDMGPGDDIIVNEGAINLDDSIIDLGDPGPGGNEFYNGGTITAEGDNFIDMGPANPNALCNVGSLDMQDGAANDSLTITGDLACDGDLRVDVSGGSGVVVSELVYIDGDVDADSNTTVHVDLLDIGPQITDDIPIVEVTGTSVPANFTLGDVDWDEDNAFVTLDFTLNSDIDASNATPDVFSLGIDVTGLSDPGTLAAAVSPGAASLLSSQIGTTRARLGIIDEVAKGGISLWARLFQNRGDFAPEHASSDFGTGGNFDWDQRNRGIEAGVDFGVGETLNLGLLVGKSKADVELADNGLGSSELDANTWGVYALWGSPEGFYLDAGYYWMNFDVDLASIAGPMQAEGDAEAFNIELGFAFTLGGGMQIVPQLQYTKINVKSIDVFTTSSGMTFTSDGGDSSRGRLGVALQKSFGDASTGWRFTPYLALSAVREFDGEHAFAINDSLFGFTSTKGTSGLLELGFTTRHDRLAFYGGLNWQDGGAIDQFVGGHLGVRYTFGGAAPAPAPAVPAAAAPAPVTCAQLDDDSDGVNNCDDRCPGSAAGTSVGPDGCPVPAPEPEPAMAPKPYRG